MNNSLADRTSTMSKGKSRRLESALALANSGFWIFPLHSPVDDGCSCGNSECSSIGKHPRVKGGFKEASVDAETIERWWHKWPLANIGVATGPSGLVVIDVDLYHHGAKEAWDGLVGGMGNGCFETVTALSGGGGEHYYYRAPEGLTIKCGTGVLGAGIDVRADGGYIVAPPSKHASGKRYRFVTGYGPEEVGIAPLPDYLLSMLTSGSERNGPVAPANENVPEGQRNDRIYREGKRLLDAGMGQKNLVSCLRAINADSCDPPLPEAEVENIIASLEKKRPTENLKFVFLSRQDLRNIPEPTWLIEDVLPAGGLTMLVGAPGAGKTFTAIDIAASVATGREWMGYKTDRGTVLYVAAEAHMSLKIRVPAWERYNGVKLADDEFWCVPQSLSLIQPASVEQFIEAVEQRRITPSLMVFDTLARCMPGGDENSAKDMSTVVASCERLQKHFDATILLVHHPGKGKGALYRGHSAIEGALDTLITFTRATAKGVGKLGFKKQKDSMELSPIPVRLVSEGRSAVITADYSRDDEEEVSSPSQVIALDALKDLRREKGEVQVSYSDWQRASQLASTTFARAVNGLVNAELVAKRARGRYEPLQKSA